MFPQAVSPREQLVIPKGVAELTREQKLRRRCRCRACLYLNNIIEQTARGIKSCVDTTQGFVRSMERGGRFKATRHGYGPPMTKREALKQTGRSEIGAGALLSALRDRISNHGKSIWPTTRLTELRDFAEKGENPMAGVESKAVIGDSQWPRNTYPGTT